MKKRPEKLKFHHPGSGRKKAVPFAKGRQAKKKDLEALRDLPWEKTAPFWEGRLAIQGRMNKSKIGMELTANLILTKMGISLDENRQKFEEKAR